MQPAKFANDSAPRVRIDAFIRHYSLSASVRKMSLMCSHLGELPCEASQAQIHYYEVAASVFTSNASWVVHITDTETASGY